MTDFVIADVRLEPSDFENKRSGLRNKFYKPLDLGDSSDSVRKEFGEPMAVGLYMFTGSGIVNSLPRCNVGDLLLRRGYLVDRAVHLAARQAGFPVHEIVRIVIGRVEEYDLMFSVLAS